MKFNKEKIFENTIIVGLIIVFIILGYLLYPLINNTPSNKELIRERVYIGQLVSFVYSNNLMEPFQDWNSLGVNKTSFNYEITYTKIDEVK